MSRWFVVLSVLGCAGLVGPACSSKDDKEKDKPAAKQPVKPEQTRPPAKRRVRKKPPRPLPITCVRVFMTKPVTEGEGKLTLTMDGKTTEAVYDPKVEYKENMVWMGVDTPPACGLVSVGKKPALLLVPFFKSGDKPVVRLQLNNVSAGKHQLAQLAKARTASALAWHDDAPWTLQFTSGTIKITPNPLVPGKVTVEVKGAGDSMTRGKGGKFTLQGTFSGVVAGGPGRK